MHMDKKHYLCKEYSTTGLLAIHQLGQNVSPCIYNIPYISWLQNSQKTKQAESYNCTISQRLLERLLLMSGDEKSWFEAPEWRNGKVSLVVRKL